MTSLLLYYLHTKDVPQHLRESEVIDHPMPEVNIIQRIYYVAVVIF